MMRKVAMAVLAGAAVLLAATAAAQAQRSTEQFIPVGQSPGLSGVFTYEGEITSVDPAARSITMNRPGDPEAVTLTVSRQTRIWLDRSLIRRPNLTGTFADLVPGSVIEIHFQVLDRPEIAEWIKIQSDRPD